MLKQVTPIVDYRGIHLKDGDFLSNTKILCNHCANPVCDDYAAKSCSEFTPTLKFKRTIGFEGEFNTFRIGRAWSKRVTEGMTVALMSAKDSRIVGYADVTRVYAGKKEALAEMFGKDNHCARALNITEDVPATMLRRLKNASGTMIYNSNPDATIIYMRMIKDAQNEEEDMD